MTTPTLINESFETLAQKVDEAIAEVRALDDKPQNSAMNMKRAIEEFHKFGLIKLVQHLKADERGKELLFELIDEPSIYAIFAMHGIVRADVPTRVERVIEMVRPYMQSHGGDVELVEVEHDTVYLRLHGACNGCSMSSVTLRNGVEEALNEHVPEIKNIEVIPNEPSVGMVTLETITVQKGWVTGPTVEEVQEGRPFRLDTDDGVSIVIFKIDNQIHAFHNMCAHQGLPIDGGLMDVEAKTITCPYHGFCFDATSGECLTAPQAQLEPFPVRIEDGIIQVRPS